MSFSRRSRMIILIIYFLIINILFTLPGSAFPSDDWMSRIWFDKWVHIGIFFCLAIICGWALSPTSFEWILFLAAAIAYGLLVEFAQDRWIPNRSFDWGDWMADIAGALAGLLFARGYTKK